MNKKLVLKYKKTTFTNKDRFVWISKQIQSMGMKKISQLFLLGCILDSKEIKKAKCF